MKGQGESLPRCGSTWEQIGKRQQMGCGECYPVRQGDPGLVPAHGGKTPHRGKLPKRLRTYKTYQSTSSS
jgi:protein-arginine kinase activator protein McsA